MLYSFDCDHALFLVTITCNTQNRFHSHTSVCANRLARGLTTLSSPPPPSLSIPLFSSVMQNIQSRCPALSVVDLCGTNINPEAFARSDGEGGVDVTQGGAPLNWHSYL